MEQRKNTKKQIESAKLKIKDILMGGICNKQEEIKEKIEEMQEAKEAEDFKFSDYLNAENFELVKVNNWGEIHNEFKCQVKKLPITHITQGVTDTTRLIKQNIIQYLSNITGLNLSVDDCEILNRDFNVGVKIHNNLSVEEITLTTTRNTKLSRLINTLFGTSFIHNHCSTNRCCLGGYQTLMSNSLQSYDMKSFLITLKRYFQSVDIADSWGVSLLKNNNIIYCKSEQKYYLINKTTYNYTSYVLQLNYNYETDTLNLEKLYIYCNKEEYDDDRTYSYLVVKEAELLSDFSNFNPDWQVGVLSQVIERQSEFVFNYTTPLYLNTKKYHIVSYTEQKVENRDLIGGNNNEN